LLILLGIVLELPVRGDETRVRGEFAALLRDVVIEVFRPDRRKMRLTKDRDQVNRSVPL
jgi:hypothetical protein